MGVTVRDTARSSTSGGVSQAAHAERLADDENRRRYGPPLIAALLSFLFSFSPGSRVAPGNPPGPLRGRERLRVIDRRDVRTVGPSLGPALTGL